MKINPINNYQINRNQKAQAKSNPIFEGVRFVPDRALAEKYLSNNGEITSKSLRKIGAKFKNISDYVNKKILPIVLAKKIIPYVNNNTVFPDNVKNIEDLAKILWPEDTDVKINCEIEETYWPKHFTTIKFFDCINGNNPLIETTFKDSNRFENNRSGLNDILTIFAGAILKNSHEFSIYSTRLDDWLSKLHGLNENFHTNNLENLLSTLIEHQPKFKSFIKQLEDTAKLATQSNLENLENSIKNCEQKEIDSNNTKDIESKSLSGIKPTPLLAEGSALKAWLGDEFEDYINSVIDIINEKNSITAKEELIETENISIIKSTGTKQENLKIYPTVSPSRVVQDQPIATQPQTTQIESNKVNQKKRLSESELRELISTSFNLVVLIGLLFATIKGCKSVWQKIQGASTNRIEFLANPTEDARMQKGDINYEEEMEYARQEIESMRQRAEQQMEQARQEMEELRKNFRF